MENQLTTQEYKNNEIAGAIFSTATGFELGQRIAKALASSTIVPKEYQNNLGNCLIAIEMASRMKTNPLLVMQNLYVVNGRPAWSSQYIIAMINQSRKYKTPLQFVLEGKGETLSCYAWAEDKNGHKDIGPEITYKMAKAEGWVTRNGSKWQTMPEVMIRYRAASFFGRLYCSDMLMGLYSADEAREMVDLYEQPDGSYAAQREADAHENAEELPVEPITEPAPAPQPPESLPDDADANPGF